MKGVERYLKENMAEVVERAMRLYPSDTAVDFVRYLMGLGGDSGVFTECSVVARTIEVVKERIGEGEEESVAVGLRALLEATYHLEEGNGLALGSIQRFFVEYFDVIREHELAFYLLSSLGRFRRYLPGEGGILKYYVRNYKRFGEEKFLRAFDIISYYV